MLGLENMTAVAIAGPSCRQESLAGKAVTSISVHVSEKHSRSVLGGSGEN